MNTPLPYMLAAAGVITLAAVAANPRIESLKSAKEASIIVPSTPDSLFGKENAFEASQLLSGIHPLSPLQAQAQAADYTTILPDTAGRFTLSAPADKKELKLQRFLTNIRSDKFFKGKLRAKMAGVGKIYLDGKEIASRQAADSVAADLEGNFTLQPYRDAQLELHLLNDSQCADPSLQIEIIPDKGYENAALSQGSDMKRRFNLDNTVMGARITDVELSPDGRYILANLGESDDGLTTQYSLILQESSTGKAIAENILENWIWIESRPSSVAFTRADADGTYSLIAMEIPSMKQEILASGLPEEAASKSFTLSPNEDYLIFNNVVKGKADTGVMRRLKSPDDRQPGDRDRSYLSILNFSDNIVRPLTYGGASSYLLDISPDGKKILYSSVRQTPAEFPFYDQRLVQLDVKTLAADTIPGVDSSMTGAIYSPDASKLFILAGPNAFNGIGLNAGAHEWGNDFDIQGYIMDLPSGQVSAMTRDFDPSITGQPVWLKADNQIYFRAEAGFDIPVYTLNPKSGEIKKLPIDVDYVRSFSVASRKADQMVYSGMSYFYSGREYLLNLKNGKNRLIADPLGPTLADMNLGSSQTWQFKASDGTTIDGTLTLPPDFDESKKYPMIVYYYGGTTPSTHASHSPYSPVLFASRGYVVYTINPSGTIGYGQEFSARHVNAWGERTADDIIEGVKEICTACPFIDSAKIGCIGASYGGFMTQLLQTKTDIFAAAVSHAGISDITSYWGEGFWGYSYNAVAAARSYPWNNPKLFTEHSPLFNADKIHTPLLLLHGNVDTNVPIGESIQLYNALKILGREVEFVAVDGQNHIILDLQKRREWHATIMAWFERWLKDDPAWWDSIYK